MPGSTERSIELLRFEGEANLMRLVNLFCRPSMGLESLVRGSDATPRRVVPHRPRSFESSQNVDVPTVFASTS